MVQFTNQIIIILVLYHKALSVNITCVSEQSPISGGNYGNKTSVTCSNPDHTLLSCGFQTQYDGENDILGGWIEGQTCWAENSDNSGGGGVYAFARCCDLKEYGLTCNTVESDLSGPNNGDRISASCGVGEKLMGCTSRSFGGRQNGNYVGEAADDIFTMASNDDVVSNSNSCTAYNSEGNAAGVRAYATCCSFPDNKVSIDCVTRYRDLTEFQWTTSCPPAGYDDYFMTSCSAVNAVRDMNQWKVKIGTNTCHVRNSDNDGGENDYGIASMICCSITTVSPTNTPSISPTSAPSNSPTPAPSITPTQPPSLNPSISPTQPPSIAPTSPPSNNPSA
eukprot:125490_1